MIFGREKPEKISVLDEPLSGGGQSWLFRPAVLALLLLVMTTGGIAGWWVLHDDRTGPATADTPVIRADGPDIKKRPDDPGGRDFPHQDKMVFDRIDPAGAETPAERLLPRPEVPELDALAGAAPPDDPVTDDPIVDGPVTDDLIMDDLIVDGPVTDDPIADAITLSVGTASVDIAPVDIAAAPPGTEEMARASPPLAASDDAGIQTGRRAPADLAAAPQPEAPAPPLTPAQPDTLPRTAHPADAVEQPATAAAAPPLPQGWRIQIASLKNETAALTAWQQLRTRHADVLGDLTLDLERVILLDGIFYRIQSTPFPDKEAAQQACDILTSRAQGCLVVKR